MIIFLLTVTLYLTKTEINTKKSPTQLSYYRNELLHRMVRKTK